MADNPLSRPAEMQISASAHHDLLTPLNQIIGYSEMLAEDAETSGRADWIADLERITQAARQIVAQLDQLFSLLKRTDGPLSPEPESRAPDHGISLDAVPSAAEWSEKAAGPAGKILVVDDDELNRDLLSRRLERQGYTTVLAENGMAALEKLAREPFDLVLLDVMMPEMDGYQTLARIKANPASRHLPVIMISAQTELDSVVRCIELGAEDYLPKPSDPVLLWARVGASLEKKRLREQEQEHREQALRSEATLERHRALTQMVAGVAHEINTPLGIANTALSVIENRLASPAVRALFEAAEETREILADILDAGALLKSNVLRAHRLVETFKKISVGQITETREPTDLPRLVADAVDLFRISAHQARLSIDINTAGIRGDPVWLGYPGYLIQVILNFVQNIERYAYPDGQGGKVDISVRDEMQDHEPWFVIVVRDYGKGISPEDLPRIFEPFFTTGRNRGGTGLGLAIVNNIVGSALKGHVSVTSEPGQGTAFTVSFPKTIPE